MLRASEEFSETLPKPSEFEQNHTVFNKKPCNVQPFQKKSQGGFLTSPNRPRLDPKVNPKSAQGRPRVGRPEFNPKSAQGRPRVCQKSAPNLPKVGQKLAQMSAKGRPKILAPNRSKAGKKVGPGSGQKSAPNWPRVGKTFSPKSALSWT